MEDHPQENLDGDLVQHQVFGVKFQPQQFDPGTIFSNSVRIVKPVPTRLQDPYVNDSNDYQTINRQKVSRLDSGDASSSHQSNDVGQILNVQVKSQAKNIPELLLKYVKPVPAVFHDPQKSTPPRRDQNFPIHQSIKTKTQEISKEVQDIVEDHNSAKLLQTQGERHCHFDKEVSEEDINVILSDANLTPIEKGTFGTVLTSPKNPSLVLKQTAMRVNPNEILVPLRLKGCPNIVQNYAVHACPGKFCIVQQYCGESLKMLVKQPQFNNYFKDMPKRLSFIEGMFCGVEVLENTRACHGDLKLENICARVENGFYVPRLIDFGTCQASSDRPTLEGISPEFLPPKVNYFALQLMEKKVDPNDQRMMLFEEQSDSWSVAMISLCLWYEGLHPLLEVQSYVRFDLEERLVAMRKIASLTEQDINSFRPIDMDPVTLQVVFRNLNLCAAERWGALKTVHYLRRARLQQAGNTSPEIDVNLKRGKKRPVSPFHPATAAFRTEDDVSELMDLFKSFQKKKPPDEVSAPKSEPSDVTPGGFVKPQSFGMKSPPHQGSAQEPERGKKLISTLKFKPDQQARGEWRAPKKEVPYPEDASQSGFAQPLVVQPDSRLPNIPNMGKLEASQPPDLQSFRVKARSQKMVPPEEEEGNFRVANSPHVPDFDLLGVSWDMNEPPAQNLPIRDGGKTPRRRNNKSRMK